MTVIDSRQARRAVITKVRQPLTSTIQRRLRTLKASIINSMRIKKCRSKAYPNANKVEHPTPYETSSSIICVEKEKIFRVTISTMTRLSIEKRIKAAAHPPSRARREDKRWKEVIIISFPATKALGITVLWCFRIHQRWLVRFQGQLFLSTYQ